MKRFFILATAVLLLFSCVSSAPQGDIGSFDAGKVQLLSDGKAAVVDVLCFNDFHGTIYEDPLGKNVGIAKIATIVNRLKTLNPNTVLVSAGDNYQGSALSIVSQGAIISEFFKYIGVAASAVGNHEFDWGDNLFQTWTADGGFPFLAANLIDKRTGKIASFVKPYTIVRIGGRRIAFIGLSTTETPRSTKAQFVENYEFANPTETARYWVNYLKATEKPDVIIGLTHIPSAANGMNKSVAISTSDANELADLADRGGLDAIITG
ncbi:MAG TPA: metallophosphoesterase, partial [Spirochaetia bacterium]|nr:metallophosphoesterase [Spirochaetia bacterium]